MSGLQPDSQELQPVHDDNMRHVKQGGQGEYDERSFHVFMVMYNDYVLTFSKELFVVLMDADSVQPLVGA